MLKNRLINIWSCYKVFWRTFPWLTQRQATVTTSTTEVELGLFGQIDCFARLQGFRMFILEIRFRAILNIIAELNIYHTNTFSSKRSLQRENSEFNMSRQSSRWPTS
ncbi:hypothetical protein GWI33_018026 [Rhynchophorus ferrugineus]|uniref:Uncharacterized protein n=1 Tax=Rhynchophorus ferrugineus TaxID=354439 RepID=A0A834HYN9_RHYFE|nr:hypothetical protein GWI33_018026 [Rhynchophorus ferrugineus]